MKYDVIIGAVIDLKVPEEIVAESAAAGDGSPPDGEYSGSSGEGGEPGGDSAGSSGEEGGSGDAPGAGGTDSPTAGSGPEAGAGADGATASEAPHELETKSIFKPGDNQLFFLMNYKSAANDWEIIRIVQKL